MKFEVWQINEVTSRDQLGFSLSREHRHRDCNRFGFRFPVENVGGGKHHEAGGRAFHGSWQASVACFLGPSQQTQTNKDHYYTGVH
ncbi:hypothetical protein COLO4_25366 [Corchorus olitorius]|uniref:Uncharacterized protein n=1 Tax=Corchorus olitorius TaxID=93759 RepID=A0A1R3I3C2_9ROSI|nr:hypothetical protein COLO4_25366 [Corchorus olitorius]